MQRESRRDFVKKAVYIVPAVLSINIALVEARAGSHDMQMGGAGGASPRGTRKASEPGRDARRTDRE